MGVNTRFQNEQISSQDARPLGLTVITMLFGLLAVCLLWFTIAEYAPGHFWASFFESSTFWQYILAGLLTYGLFYRLAWARWAAFNIVAFIFGWLLLEVISQINTTVDSRYPLWNEFYQNQYFIWFVVILALAAVVFVPLCYFLTRLNVVNLQPALKSAPYMIFVTVIGWAVTGISVVSLFWGLYQVQVKWDFLECRPDVHNHPLENFVIPAIVLLLAGIGLIRREAWARWVGGFLVVALVTYLAQYYFSL